jgi:hypothetical protein
VVAVVRNVVHTVGTVTRVVLVVAVGHLVRVVLAVVVPQRCPGLDLFLTETVVEADFTNLVNTIMVEAEAAPEVLVVQAVVVRVVPIVGRRVHQLSTHMVEMVTATRLLVVVILFLIVATVARVVALCEHLERMGLLL